MAGYPPLRVLVLAPYPLHRAPSQRFRVEQFIEPLRERGIELETASFLSGAAMDAAHRPGAWATKANGVVAGTARRLRDAVRARKYGLVLVHREAFPLGPAWVEPTLRAMGIPYVFDFDDAIYLPASSEANRRLSWLKNPGKTRTSIRNASLVVAGNPHLAEWAGALNSRVLVVPTAIDTARYAPAEAESNGSLCVGWTGSATTVQHLRPIDQMLRDLQRERGVRLRVISDANYSIEGAAVETLPWREATEIADLQEIDIGVMPLPDDEWARGKCGFKALQYMALGIPTIVSPVGVNRRIARDGAALLAADLAEWREAMHRLIDDEELRRSTGAAGRRRVEDEYSLEATLPLWEHALRTAAAAPRSRGAQLATRIDSARNA